MIGRAGGKRDCEVANRFVRALTAPSRHWRGSIGALLRLGLGLGCGRASAERLTVATYNVENYVTVGRRVEGVYRTAYPKPEEEKMALRAVIGELHADVIVLQEMGPRPFLNELQRDLAKEGCAYPFGEIVAAADGERHLAILSRKPFVRWRQHTDLRFSYFGSLQPVKRGLLEAVFHVGHSDLVLFGVHLKSRITDRSEDYQSTYRRGEEARAVRDRISEEYPDPNSARILLLGDCNDVPRSKPLVTLLRRGKTKLFEMLPATDSRGESWTEWYHREDSYSRIDYALVSPALLPAVVDGTAMIADGPATLVASDHRPLVLTLDLP